ncbi:MAG: S1 family peptidase [Deltaproteobacteria bacterium]|jgi:V8-like Glu-specific endopeptidase|nr:S1 family peptidase [Deltaproteobacteria bacterium]
MRNQVQIPPWTVLLLSALAPGCALEDAVSVDAASLGTERSALMNGEEGAHPAVGRVFTDGMCTGTVIGPDAVLTAAHCLARPRPDPSVPWSEIIDYPVGFAMADSTAGFGYVYHESYQASIHPDYDRNVHLDLSVADLVEGDIAVLHFEAQVADAYVPLASSVPAVGEELMLVGFGRDGPDGGTGYSQIGFAPVARVTEHNIISYGPLSVDRANDEVASICPGDSGGPSFAGEGASEVLVGVHSTNGPYDSADCGRETWDIRVDRARSWIDCAIRRYWGDDCDDGKTDVLDHDDTADDHDGDTSLGGCAVPGVGRSGAGFRALFVLTLLLIGRRRSGLRSQVSSRG